MGRSREHWWEPRPGESHPLLVLADAREVDHRSRLAVSRHRPAAMINRDVRSGPGILGDVGPRGDGWYQLAV